MLLSGEDSLLVGNPVSIKLKPLLHIFTHGKHGDRDLNIFRN